MSPLSRARDKAGPTCSENHNPRELSTLGQLPGGYKFNNLFLYKLSFFYLLTIFSLQTSNIKRSFSCWPLTTNH